MRTIKFRAWDKVGKQMSEPFALFGEFTLMGAVHSWQHEFRSGGDSIGYLNDLEIMQFTGLLDKNGKEIYEGDILTFLDAETISTENGMDFNESMGRGVVEWCDYEGRWDVTNRDSVDLEDIFGEPGTEIIGNIHENPELLP